MKKNKTPQDLALKPCPFCGSNPVKGLSKKTGCSLHGNPIQRVNVSCNKRACPAKPFIEGCDRYSSGYEKGEKFKECEARAYEAVIKVWNTRPAISAILDENEQLRDALESILTESEFHAMEKELK